jgi:hypothetical protein
MRKGERQMSFETTQWLFQRISEYALSAVSSREGASATIGEIGGMFPRLTSGLALSACYLTIAGAAYCWFQKNSESSVPPFMAFLFPRAVDGHPSEKLDYRFYLVSALLNVLLISLWWSASGFSQRKWGRVCHRISGVGASGCVAGALSLCRGAGGGPAARLRELLGSSVAPESFVFMAV